MSLFDDFDRTLVGGAGNLISSYDYLNESARPAAAAIRGKIDEYLERYPQAHREQLISRLRSGDDVAHNAAIFELVLHEMLLRAGATVLAIEPPLPGRNRSPDFLVRGADGDRFYLEAAVASGRSTAGAAALRRFNEALDAIEQVVSSQFFLLIHHRGEAAQSISTGRLRRQIQAWIDSGLLP